MQPSGLSSIIQAAALSSTTFTVTLALYFAYQRRSPGLPWWLAGNAMLSLAMHLYVLRAQNWVADGGYTPAVTFLAVLLPGLLISAGALCALLGFRELIGRRGVPVVAVALLGVQVCSHSTFTYLVPDFAGRSLSLNLYLCLCCGMVARLIFRHGVKDFGIVARVVGGIWLTISILHLIRLHEIITAICNDPPDLWSFAGSRSFIVTAAVSVLWTMGGLIMAALRERRLAAESRNLEIARERDRTLTEQRRRLSRDLHDTLGGINATIGVLASSAISADDRSIDREALGKIHQLSREAQSELRSLLNKLSRQELSLATWLAEFREMAGVMAEGSGARLDWTAEGFDEHPSGDALAGVHLIRALREVCNNAMRHSGASRWRVHAEAGDGVMRLEIADNGCGMSGGRTSGHGLVNIRSRIEELGGTVEIRSAEGTCVSIRVPLPMGFVVRQGSNPA
jgi:signal transduction histidine kinase